VTLPGTLQRQIGKRENPQPDSLALDLLTSVRGDFLRNEETRSNWKILDGIRSLSGACFTSKESTFSSDVYWIEQNKHGNHTSIELRKGTEQTSKKSGCCVLDMPCHVP
jgi:hypothetical protein